MNFVVLIVRCEDMCDVKKDMCDVKTCAVLRHDIDLFVEELICLEAKIHQSLSMLTHLGDIHSGIVCDHVKNTLSTCDLYQWTFGLAREIRLTDADQNMLSF